MAPRSLADALGNDARNLTNVNMDNCPDSVRSLRMACGFKSAHLAAQPTNRTLRHGNQPTPSEGMKSAHSKLRSEINPLRVKV